MGNAGYRRPPPRRSSFLRDGGRAPDAAVVHVLRGVGEFRGRVARRLLPGFELGDGRAVFAEEEPLSII